MSRIGWDIEEDIIDPQEDDPAARSRLNFLRLLILIIFVGLLARVIWLQQTRCNEDDPDCLDFQALAEDNQFAILEIDAPRGIIFDRNGNKLADNVPSFNVAITPAFIPSDDAERAAVFERLSILTGVPVTNTLQQQILLEAADPAIISQYNQLAGLFGETITDTLDASGVVPILPDSIIYTYEKFGFAQYLPAPIKTGITITEAQTIAQESVFLPGVQVIPEPLRIYPSGDLTAHLIGFMGPLPDRTYLDRGYQIEDRVGLFGLESSMEELLRGTKGQRQIEVDWTGREVRQIGPVIEPVPGYNLHLTLDLDLQEEATRILLEIMEDRRNTPNELGQSVEVEQGVVVVMNPNTGEILAMVNTPTFDNNRFATEIPLEYYLGLARNDYLPLFNHAIGGQYPPGSVYKLVTAAGALQEGVISASRFLQAPGAIRIPNRFAPNDPGREQEFVCWINAQGGTHELMNMPLAISRSCDIYFYKINGGFDQDGEFVDGLGADLLFEYSQQFGFNQVQGIELPAEAPGIIPNQAWKRQTRGEPWSTGDDYNMSIGQGFVLATPMQIAQMTAVVANGGFLYRPSLIHHLTDANGNVVIFDEVREQYISAILNEDGSVTYTDPQGNILSEDERTVSATFDANGEFIYQPEVLQAVSVDREYIEVVQEGMRLTNLEGGIGSGIQWLDSFDIPTAGKSGTAEYCDNIAISRGWCIEGQVLPTHSWYVGYAPFDDPEIVVAAFIFNGGEGSQWAGPVVRNVMAYHFQVDQYAIGTTPATAPIPVDPVTGLPTNPIIGTEEEDIEPSPDTEP